MAPVGSIPTLSEDLISEILIRVPVKSLVCCQAVCKTWLSITKNPSFVKSQLRHATTTQSKHTLIVTCFKPCEENRFLLLDVDSRELVTDLNFPYSPDEHIYVPFCTLVGSANGIVCVAVILADQKTSLYLWNPATRQSKVIPTVRDIFQDALGFGYDPIDRDYKVVRNGIPPSVSEVYSANGNVWRKVNNVTDAPRHSVFDVCVNGLLCGIGACCDMLVFDLNKEVLHCDVRLPFIYLADATTDDDAAAAAAGDEDDAADGDEDAAADGDDDAAADGDDDDAAGDDDGDVAAAKKTHFCIESNDAHIMEFNKCIAVIVVWGEGSNDEKKISMWTLDDEACLRGSGGEASWTLMFTIDLDLGVPVEFIHGYYSNGDLLVMIHDDEVWISCNVGKKEAKILPLSVDTAKHLYTRHVYKYTESLVSFAGFKQVDWKDNATYPKNYPQYFSRMN